jgi:Holliday junction resolvasome RuvABC DNA-binding subunit
MIAYLRGRVLAITAETAILDIGGVGYEVYCSASAFSRMTQG